MPPQRNNSSHLLNFYCRIKYCSTTQKTIYAIVILFSIIHFHFGVFISISPLFQSRGWIGIPRSINALLIDVGWNIAVLPTNGDGKSNSQTFLTAAAVILAGHISFSCHSFLRAWLIQFCLNITVTTGSDCECQILAEVIGGSFSCLQKRG